MKPNKKFNLIQKTILFKVLLVILLSTHNSFSQSVSVDTSKTTEELVNVLIGTSCFESSNYTSSSNQSIGYFNNNNSSFPINEGIIIRNGNAMHTEGSYTGQNLSSEINTNTDSYLQDIINNAGQTSTITDVAFLEFDFTPNGTEFNFDFLFASNEYGEWQCGFSDVFAFILTNTSTGESVNLAVIPGTSTSISVKDIRDNSYNSSCNSVNENLFSTYNVNNTSASTINMRGHTMVMNASASVEPSQLYTIKLVIGDFDDSTYDSAVFIASGSFNSSIDLGTDIAICSNEEILIDTDLQEENNTFKWTRNGVLLAGENNSKLTVNQIGIYEVEALVNNDCLLTDIIEVKAIEASQPNDIYGCDNGENTFFDLSQNNYDVLNIDASLYEILYYSSLNNANSNTEIAESQVTNYQSVGNQEIYIKIKTRTTNSICSTLVSFQIKAVDLTATTPEDILVCEDEPIVDIPFHAEAAILTGLNTLNYTVSYFINQEDAAEGLESNKINIPNAFSLSNETTKIWARINSNLSTNCFDIVDFNIILDPLPLVDTLPNKLACYNFTLPELANGSYFTGPDGTGDQLFPGDLIEDSGYYYIYNMNENGCSNQRVFTVHIADKENFSGVHCAQYVVPEVRQGHFFTSPGGFDGEGEEIIPGTTFTNSTRFYFYVSSYNDSQDVCEIDKQFIITIQENPSVDELEDVFSCDGFILPELSVGEYFTKTSGQGTKLNAGALVNRSKTIYIYFNNDYITPAGTLSCSNESSFKVEIIDLLSFNDITECGSYTIPALPYGNYFLEPNGAGNIISTGTILTESEKLFFYTPVIDDVNCTTDFSINLTINPLPLVDEMDDVVSCIDRTYILPSLTNGSYYTNSGGNGIKLNTGDVVSTSQTIYIFNEGVFCTNQSSFQVEIRALPLVDNFTDVFLCGNYTLPHLNHGNYHTEPNGQGTLLLEGDIIETTQKLYIYNKFSDLESCNSENSFTINILGISVDKPADVIGCETYTLPTLTLGSYFTEPDGKGIQLSAGDLVTSTQTLYIYAENGNRFFCSDTHEFTITIAAPKVQNFKNQEACGSFTLENSTTLDYTVSYYTHANGEGLISPSDYTITHLGTQTIYARTSYIEKPDCFVEENFTINIKPLRELMVEGGFICIDAQTGETTKTLLLESFIDPYLYSVEWFFNGQLVGVDTNYEALEEGVYTIETTLIPSEINQLCNYLPSKVEVKALRPEAKITFLTEQFKGLSNVQVDFLRDAYGTYEYQLNNGVFQSSNVFTGIPAGNHIITVRDLSNYCGNFTLPFTVMGYPKFFTPNGDGINDTWNIENLDQYKDAVVTIFDRYGRFIKKIKPSGQGWDGAAKNGSPSIPNSYWFKVDYKSEGKMNSFNSYFSLVRN